jgi:hypothetical protein
MEFKEGNIIVTKDGEYPLKKMMTMYNPFTLTPVTIFIIDNNGKERSVTEKDVISVKNNDKNMLEP